MSADLFAEFNDPSSSTPKTSVTKQPRTNAPAVTSPNIGQLDSNSFQDYRIPGSSQSHWPSSQTTPSIPSSSWNHQSSWPTQQPGLQTTSPEDDDGWGDFEVAEPAESGRTAETKRAHHDEFKHASGEKPASEPTPGIVRASTMDIMSNNLIYVETAPDSEQPSQPHISKAESFQRYPAVHQPAKQVARDPNVLFDAEEFELQGDDSEDGGFDDDDFGDFETTVSAASTAPATKQTDQVLHDESAVPATNPQHPTLPPAMDLLGLDDMPTIASCPGKPQQSSPALARPSTKSPKPTHSFGSTSSQHRVLSSSSSRPASKSQPIRRQEKATGPNLLVVGSSDAPIQQTTVSDVDDDDWGAWDDFSGQSKPPDVKQPPTDWRWRSSEPTSSEATESDAAPPANVPPPSVILSAFPDLFASGDALFRSVSSSGPSIKDRILSDPKTVDFLRGYLLLATTAGRVIAGRKQRWHRDKILAKSMSISTAGSKGMKLAGVDKTQAAREDREAEDVAAAWKTYVGKVRSAVAAANSAAGNASLKVPELNVTFLVHTAKLAPTSTRPCVICGLKREERVAKVDFDVEDSFGEWWVEHWGHRACKNFWIEHEQNLRQR